MQDKSIHMKLDTLKQLSSITIVLHWLIAFFMIGLLVAGVYMVETKTYSFYSWHKAIGFIIFIFILARVAWRIKNKWPALNPQHKKIEHVMSKAVDWTLIIGTVLLPVSGFMQSSISGNGVDVFGLEIVARNIDPNNVKKVLSYNKEWQSTFNFIHFGFGYAIIVALVLHILGALKHHFIDKDSTLRRMLDIKSYSK